MRKTLNQRAFAKATAGSLRANRLASRSCEAEKAGGR
jgi:hypothetical protein